MKIFGNVRSEMLFHGKGCRGSLRHEPQPVADAEYVCVYGHGGFTESYGADYARRFTSDTRQHCQLVHIPGHFPVEFIHQHFRHACKMGGLCVGI